jgi:uncharacterized protein involved in exopolysaccharide biosynthesis
VVYQPSLRDILQTFLRRKVLFAIVAGAVCLAGAGYLLLTPPLYLSGATLVLHFGSQAIPDIDRSELPSDQLQGSNEHREILYSDADILRSPELIRNVIQELGLPRLYPRIAAQNLDTARKLTEAEQVFTTNLVVDVGLQSDVLSASFLNPNAQVAHDAVQQLLNRFFAQESAVYANPQLQFAETEANSARNALTVAQDKLSAFKTQNKIANLSEQVSQLLGARTDVENRLRIAQGRVLEAQQQQDALKNLLSTVPADVTGSAIGDQYTAADAVESRLDELRAKRQQMGSTYRADSPVFAQLDTQIGSLERAARMRTAQARTRSSSQPSPVYESIKTDYLRASAEAISARQPEQVLTQQLSQINDRIADLEGQQNQYDDLTRAVQIQSDTYRALAIRYQTARVEANRNAQNISAATVISAPIVPQEPARPRRKLVALATLVAALLLAAGGVLAIEGFDDRFRTPRDVTRILRLPVLATFARDTGDA